MDYIHTISWGTFALWLIILLGLWLAYTRITVIKDFVTRVTKLNAYQFTLIIVIIILLLFVFVHPVTHGLMVMLAMVLFWSFTRGKEFNYDIFSFGKPSLEDEGFERKRYDFLLTATAESDLLTERKKLEKNLFSCPYILLDQKPQIKYDRSEYSVSFYMSSEQYVSSVMQYMTESGFNIKQINK